MRMAASTRERLVIEAMRLFGTIGFESASVSQIEAAAGLAAGSGALYHHFKSKDALLDACIDRQLDRRRDQYVIRALIAGLGDLRSELTALGRYLLAVVDDETELVQIVARTPHGRSRRLDTAYPALVDGLIADVGEWIGAWAPTMPQRDRNVLATLGVNCILGARYATSIFHEPAGKVPDETYLTEWTAVLATRIESHS